MSWNKNNTVLIQATSGFLYEGSKAEGFQVFHPYNNSNGIFSRIVREICFRIPFLPKIVWYNKDFLNTKVEYFVIWDPLITKDYIEWLHQCFPKAKIIFKYTNMIGKANHLKPNEMPKYVKVWTYDEFDSKKYNIKKHLTQFFFRSFIKPLNNAEYDIFFIGCDKGRGDKLKELEQRLKNLGIKTRFIITKDGRFSKEKPYYEKAIPYNEVIDYLTRSRSVLNIAMENQQGLTLRDMEAIFLGIKLVTTNTHIKEYKIYNKNNVFILGEDNIEQLPDFIKSPLIPVDKELLNSCTLAGLLDEITL